MAYSRKSSGNDRDPGSEKSREECRRHFPCDSLDVSTHGWSLLDVLVHSLTKVLNGTRALLAAHNFKVFLGLYPNCYLPSCVSFLVSFGQLACQIEPRLLTGARV